MNEKSYISVLERQTLACSVITSKPTIADKPTYMQIMKSEGSSISMLQSVFVINSPFGLQEEVNTSSSETDIMVTNNLVPDDKGCPPNIWPDLQKNDEINPGTDCNKLITNIDIDCQKQRNRRTPRPFSPELTHRIKKVNFKKKQKNQSPIMLSKGSVNSSWSLDKPFCCELCKSPYIVNPTRSRLPYAKVKRKPVARKVIDIAKQKVLVVCNACGLSLNRNDPQKVKKIKKIPPTAEEKANYMKDAISFAKSLAETLQEPLVERFYCPVYKLSKPCRCLQSYIMGNNDVDIENECVVRTLQLATYLKEARSLMKLKDPPDVPVKNSISNKKKLRVRLSTGTPLRRSKAFEEFVLSKRLYLRNELGFCERACQRVLMYSNNFLHKHSKTGGTKGPRVEKVIGKNVVGALKPISELANRSCCLDGCVVLAATHSALLESWRQTARLGQRQARRVLAEMLTPTGGLKANCYKFISMVTGCSYTTISLVSEQMKRTQGDREPPEHGLKKWWREKSLGEPTENSEDEDGLLLPSQAELQAMDSQQAHAELQHQRDKLERKQKRLADQQLQLEKQQMMLNERDSSTVDCGPVDSRLNLSRTDAERHTTFMPSSQLLHILKLPTTSSFASLPIARQVIPPPTISVMTSNGSFEPLGNISNISVSLPGNSSDHTTFSNVVIVPVESPLDISSLGTSTFTQSPVPVSSYEVDAATSPGFLPVSSSSTYQLFTVVDAPGNTVFQLN